MKKIYLASPYSVPNAAIQEQRFVAACIKAGELMSLGYLVYSPIAHSHPIAKFCDLPKDFRHWQKMNHEYIRWGDEVWILTLPGWEFSDGIKDEIAFGNKIGKTVRFLEDGDLTYEKAKKYILTPPSYELPPQ